MKAQKDLEISEIVNKNDEMKKYVRMLEKETDDNCSPVIKNIGDLSKRQQKRRLQALGTRAEKALWFAKHFGLELDRVEFLDSNGQKYGWNTTPSSKATSPISPEPLPTADPIPHITLNPSTSSTPTALPKSKNNQYDQLSIDGKCKVEAILFLMDKFAVGDAFIHELSMVVEGMPRSYLIKQCRNKLNSICAVKPTPGAAPGAQISFKDSLVDKLRLMVEDGKLTAGEKVKVKISGDGARMTRLTNYVILSYCVLDDSKDVLAAKGIHKILVDEWVMSGTECYESLKVSFKDCWNEINKVIHDGQVEINPGHAIPVEVFLGGDYKFLLLISGRAAANANYACLWCTIHKDQRWDMTKSGDYYNQPSMALTLADVKKCASEKQFCCKDMPLLDVPLSNIVLDELHLLLRVTDILLSNLIEDAMELDDKKDFLKKKGEPKGVCLQRLAQLINSCGVTFNVWEKRDDDGKGIGKMDWTSLMGAEKKKLLHTLPDKLQLSTEEIIHQDTADTVIKLWKHFGDIYFNCISSNNPVELETCGSRIRCWITLFLTLQHDRKGYANKNITPYMHAAAYHIQDVLDKFKNLKQFSGQGVEKNNDVARSIVLRKSNNFDSPAEVIRAEHRLTNLYKRERRKRPYKKVATAFWNGGKQEATNSKKKKSISMQRMDAPSTIVECNSSIPPANANVQQRNRQKETKKAKKTKKTKKR
ncbi:uncharacterized protein LOC114530773 [Dendronephthya gigantea]|uniref:uncharacterized protein LOC114530773 n=1 Tax=Dendronephthya gigantea TaxID=151771 RepID=UPI0010696FCC|nr:uncharacterized protein LOC114530773 [Dendronephthya gigantea]